MQKTLHTIIIMLLAISSSRSQDTFSIVAIDPNTGEVGSAGASCISYSYRISDVHPGVGAIHTQALYISQNQNYGRSLMDAGYTSQEIIDSLVANDFTNTPDVRQYGVVEFSSGSAAYTGENCSDWKGHLTGPTYSIQGNILLGEQIVDSIESGFLRTQGSLSCRLMAALQGAKVPGADTRCLIYGISTFSSFLRIARPEDILPNLYLDLDVPSVNLEGKIIDPIDSLNKLYKLTAAYGDCTITGTSFNNPTVKRSAVYPNPAGDHCILKSILPVKEIILTDELGRNQKVIQANNAVKIPIDLTAEKTGMILLNVVYENGYSERLSLIRMQ